jgi:hypothetical protein
LSEKEALSSGYEALTSPIAVNTVALWGDGTVKGDLLSLFLADHPGRAVLVRCPEPDCFEVWVRPIRRKRLPGRDRMRQLDEDSLSLRHGDPMD